MPREPVPFERMLEMIRRLPRAEQVRLFEAVGLQAGEGADEERPAPPAAGSEFHCGVCGTMLSGGDFPERCPRCGAPRERFVLEADD